MARNRTQARISRQQVEGGATGPRLRATGSRLRPLPRARARARALRTRSSRMPSHAENGRFSHHGQALKALAFFWPFVYLNKYLFQCIINVWIKAQTKPTACAWAMPA